MDYKEVVSCRICKSSNLKPYLELPDVPLCNNLSQHTRKYPIKLLFCEDCCLSQLSIVIDPKFLYSEYLYHSSVSRTFQIHCADMMKRIKEVVKFKNDPPALTDIGSNDGCLMREARKAGFVARGYEPCKELSHKAWKDELLFSINRPFNEETSKMARSWSGEDVITCTNVFAHVDDLDDFLRGCKHQMEINPDSTLIIEVPYLVNLINGKQFDTIYHEHLSYFLLKPLVKLFKNNDMTLFMVEEYPIHGGSIRIYAANGYKPVDDSVKNMLKAEEEAGFYEFSKYVTFTTEVYGLGEELIHLLTEIKELGKKVIGYGASAKGISLLNYFGIGNDKIHSIVDDTPQKQGKLTPGSNIPIVSFHNFKDEKPDYILLLAWNFRHELMQKTASFNTRYIVPIPSVELI